MTFKADLAFAVLLVLSLVPVSSASAQPNPPDLSPAGAFVAGALLLPIIIGLLVYGAFVALNACVAYEKGRNTIGLALLSIVVTPFLVYLYLLAVPSLKQQGQEE